MTVHRQQLEKCGEGIGLVEIVAPYHWKYEILNVVLVQSKGLAKILEAVLFNTIGQVFPDDVGGGELLQLEFRQIGGAVNAASKLLKEAMSGVIGKTVLGNGTEQRRLSGVYAKLVLV
jgi:hypothetical protein